MSQEGFSNAAKSNPAIATSFVTDSGTAVPLANVLQILGDATQGVSTSGATNVVTIHVTASASISWATITASQTMAINHGYICISAGGALSLLLPATASVGDIVEITLSGATSFTVTQAAGQRIRMGSSQTTLGAGGSLASTAQGDSLRMVCSVANTTWNVLSSMGNITVV